MNTKKLLERFERFNMSFTVNPGGSYEVKSNGKFRCFFSSKKGLEDFISQYEEGSRPLNEGF